MNLVSLFVFCLKNQVQNLAIRGQQGATTSSSQTQMPQALSLKQAPVPIQPASLIKNPSQGTQASAGGKTSSLDSPSEGGKKGDSAAVTEVRAINMSRSVTAVNAQPLLAPGKRSLHIHNIKSHPLKKCLSHKWEKKIIMMDIGDANNKPKTNGWLTGCFVWSLKVQEVILFLFYLLLSLFLIKKIVCSSTNIYWYM